MQDTLSKRYVDLTIVGGVISHLFLQCLLGSLLLDGFIVWTAPLFTLTAQVMPFLLDSPWLSLALAAMFLLLALPVLVVVYCHRFGKTGDAGMYYWMLAFIANSLSMGILSALLYTAYMLGSRAITPQLDHILMLLFFALLVSSAAQMRYQEEVSGNEDRENAPARGRYNVLLQLRRKAHHVLMAANLFVVTILTYTGLDGDRGFYLGMVATVSIVSASIIEAIILLTSTNSEAKSERMDDVALFDKKHLV